MKTHKHRFAWNLQSESKCRKVMIEIIFVKKETIIYERVICTPFDSKEYIISSM
jgi:hypothetical protein